MLRDLDHNVLLFAGKGLVQSPPDLSSLAEPVQALLNAYHVPTHLHTISAENHILHTLYNVNTPFLFFVQPNVHIAYHGNAENISRLRSYPNRLFSKNAIPVHAS